MIYFFSDDTTNFVTAKRQGMDAEREKKMYFTLISSYWTIHQENKIQDWQKSVKIGQNSVVFGEMMNISRISGSSKSKQNTHKRE